MPGRFIGVIMAGGRGTRFWPVSRRSMPKQFLRLSGERTMLQATADRFEGLCPREDLIVVTGIEHMETVMDQLPWIRRENLLLEPVGRNTAPCIAWAAAVLRERGGNDSLMVVVPSDHIVDSPEGFRRTIENAAVPAEAGYLVTIGVVPESPSTAYGYIERGEVVSDGVFRVSSFREKPDAGTAEGYVAEGGYFWNAGMFVWKVERILKEVKVLMPDLYRGLAGLERELSPRGEDYLRLPATSIDYGVMERSSHVAMVPAGFAWNDIGDWPSARKCGIGSGRVLSIDSDDFTVWNPERLTVLLGVSGISVVETEGATLVMDDSYSQRLKEIVSKLEDEEPGLV